MADREIRAVFRILYCEKSYALINLAGLSLAVVCCLILGLYLRSELKYEQHNVKYRQIYRVVHAFTHSGPPDRLAMTQIPLGLMLKENNPEILDFVRFIEPPVAVLIRSNGTTRYWQKVYSTDENVFKIFTHEVLYGDPKTALTDPASVAVSESFAKYYFGDINPIGKMIHPEAGQTIDATPRRITLVFRDLPENTHMKYDALFRWIDPPNIRQVLFSVRSYTYLLMPENYDINNFKAISDSFYRRFMQNHPRMANSTWECWLQPLTGIHLHSDLIFDLPAGNIYYVYGFAAVAVFILLVACINYVNLAIARSGRRAKEIGIRKILGVSRSRLMARFLGEATIFSILALFLGAILAEVLLRLTPINSLFDKRLSFSLMDEPGLLLGLLMLGLAVGLLSGLYPALYLSSIAPMSALSAIHGGKKRKFHLRELLVLTQVTVSVIVISCTVIMAQQMRYVSSKPLGFDKKNRVVINLHGLDVIEKYPTIKNELLENSHILGVSTISDMICSDHFFAADQGMVANAEGLLEATSFSYFQVEDDLVNVMGMQILQGRDFTKKYLTDVGASFVVNETLAKARGWKDPLGKRIQYSGLNGKVIGVLKDFHFKPLHSPVEPLVMWQFNDEENYRYVPDSQRDLIRRVMIVHIRDSDVRQTLEFLQEKFFEYDSRHPFEYAFLDAFIDRFYLSEERLMKLTMIFSGICIFISCLGLYGLASFTTEQRSKEIGIRKVLGASSLRIVLMLARKTLWLVLAGAVVATIVAYFAIEEWLSSFAYRIGIHPLAFLVSTLIVIAVAFATIALQSFRTAKRNPSITLRYE